MEKFVTLLKKNFIVYGLTVFVLFGIFVFLVENLLSTLFKWGAPSSLLKIILMSLIYSVLMTVYVFAIKKEKFID
ncbi:MAG TPA: hypothetical protein ENG70_04345 [Candidatus Cloacimonetes bacterium]|nr:hypothetical protein [Candidatus Cloacimonadota bacterium]HEX38073.1 hypothetical protein [Candidatus Cloacimonadota bacterium]